jgi:peptidyl-prolyl cis-trans isomerase B (cyclophilin B)
VSKRKTRERQLAKYAARRESERRRRRRQRVVAAVVALSLAAGSLIFAAILIVGGNDQPDPSATPTATASPSASPSASPTASPTPEPDSVACGASVPAAARTPIDERPTFRRMPQLDLDLDATYVATLETSCGSIEVELFPDKAPYTVNSFVFLAEEGYFDGLLFHRIANSIDVIQSGDPSCTDDADVTACPSDPEAGPGYTVPDEFFNNLPFEVGTIAMANSGAGTTGSQFFIVTGPLGSQLPASYTVFGKVSKGLDVAKRIQDIPVGEEGSPEAEAPQQRIFIERMTIAATP